PWKYLGWKISEQIIEPQKLSIVMEPKNLQDMQKLMGELQWLRPVVGISNEQLNIL
ncbi:POK11 protein, partial [Upupa epops]|nr:POK11 protein [Upupa epops]